MKILLTSFFQFPAVSGLWTHVLQLKKGLEKRGHHVDVFIRQPQSNCHYLYQTTQTLAPEKLDNIVNDTIVRAIEKNYPGAVPWIIDHEKQRYCFELAAIYFNLQQYDVIHAQDIVSSIAMSRVKSKDTPLITTIHGSLHSERVGSGLTDDPQAYRYSICQEYYGATVSDRTVVPSNWFKSFLHEEYNVPLHQMTVINNGFDVDDFLSRMNRPLCSKQHQKLILGCVARLSSEKGHRYLLEALKMLKLEYQNWECWIIGDGPLRMELESECKRLGIFDHVVFWGDQDDVVPFVSQLDVFVLPSLQESLGYAVMEAQIAGKAVIVTKAGGLPEVVDHLETGLVSPIADSEALFRNIKTVIDDKALRQRLGQNAMKAGKDRWHFDHMVESLLQVYTHGI